MLIETYNQKGERVGETRVPSEIFGVEINPDLVHQVVVSQMANLRPWRQKGTGRARAGSIRSPLWRGGGVTFGPRKEKVFKKKIPQKMKRKAIFMVLSGKLKNNLLILLDDLKIERSKTKLMGEALNNLKKKVKHFKEGSVLVALPKVDKNIVLAARNLPKTETILAKDLNVLDLLSFKYLILTKEAIKQIKEAFLKK